MMYRGLWPSLHYRVPGSPAQLTLMAGLASLPIWVGPRTRERERLLGYLEALVCLHGECVYRFCTHNTIMRDGGGLMSSDNKQCMSECSLPGADWNVHLL